MRDPTALACERDFRARLERRNPGRAMPWHHPVRFALAQVAWIVGVVLATCAVFAVLATILGWGQS